MSDDSVAVPSTNVVQASSRRAAPAWIYAYLAIQLACHLALLVPAFVPARVVFRMAAFGASLAFLVFAPGRSSGLGLPRSILMTCLAVMALAALNPSGGGALASLAHWMFQLAIVAPVFWVTRIALDTKALERVVLILWLFAAASAAVGVLQAIFPGHFQPPLSIILAERASGPTYVASMSIRLASGEWILRPAGLTDVPGGAAVGGLYAILFGIGVLQARPFTGARWLALVAMVAGMTCLYLSQVRALIVMLGIALLSLVAVQAFTGRLKRVLVASTVAAGVIVLGFTVALSLGGSAVTDRLGTLTQDSPGTVYYKNRGVFLEHTFAELLSEYALGAGLGRWGMMNTYFGDRAQKLWVEIQWTGWLLDGGILLLVLYPAAVLATLWQSISIARREAQTRLGVWAALIAAYNVGALALTFSYPFFMSASGLEFWLLNAALTRAAASASEGVPQSVPERPS